MRQIILDTETTGLSPEKGDRIIEIGCVELLHRKPTGHNLHHYINPQRDSHEDAIKIHGISNEFLRDKPTFGQIVHSLLTYLQGAELIIHNAPFDTAFLNHELSLLGLPPIQTNVTAITDTLLMAKDLYPGKRNNLDALCERLGVDNASRTFHGALLDAQLLADVYLCLTRGQNELLPEHHHTRATDQLDRVDLSHHQLPILTANLQEQQAHQAQLIAIDKTSKGKTIWRTFNTA